jgi:hypothetical protein
MLDSAFCILVSEFPLAFRLACASMSEEKAKREERGG